MSELPLEDATPRAAGSIVGSPAALIAVGAVAGVGVLVSVIGLLTLDADATAASLYAGGFGAGLLSLLFIGVAAGARGTTKAALADDDPRVHQVEMHADRIEGVARSLSEEHQWPPDELESELESAERAYGLALRIGATEHARRLTYALAYVRARTGARMRPPEPERRSRARRFEL